MNLKLTVAKIACAFPQAIQYSKLVAGVSESLEPYGYGPSTLLCSSLCCDEVCQDLDFDFGKKFDKHYFSMGGLAGFPFGGLTSFGAMVNHIPDGGSCLVLYGPHVGVDSRGKAGTVERRGRNQGGACCGSACAAFNSISDIEEWDQEKMFPENELDVEQFYVEKMLMPYRNLLIKAEDPMVELPYALFEAQDKMMTEIVEQGAGAVGEGGGVALLGGIQINTPGDMEDFFLPLRAEVRTNQNELIAEFL
eukprot:CAMPEP_0198153128 /NCGR_PEP_ID=MMETSP1443-20131203/62820_1 /TAXON_ID=186043 /ORGANISM="Entomoneis sp., Strain CCMP2396" /LENGTH=249 /DNA_ID=CAMNT_0043819361 /DNA_START=156 /DNA_END=901 /DNA_ORIENTATION=+